MAARPFSALVQFRNSVVVPEEHLTGGKLEVVLTSDHRMRTAWRGAIVIADGRPWAGGDVRRVELQIEAKPFEDYVACWRPILFVCRNDEIIGQLELSDPSDDGADQSALNGRDG